MHTLVVLLASALWLDGSLAAQQPHIPPQSIADLEAAARRDSNDAFVHYRLAMAYRDKKHWDEAEHSLHEALAVAPNYADAHLALGVTHLERGESYWTDRLKSQGREKTDSELIEAQQQIIHAFKLNPLVDLRVFGKYDPPRGILLVSRGRTYRLPVEPWWTSELIKAVNELQQAKYQEGFDRLKELAADKRFGGDDRTLPARILLYHGLAAAHLQNYDVAVRDFAILTGRSFAAEQDSTRRDAAWLPLKTNDYRYIMGTMLYLGNRYDEAIPVFRRVLEVDVSLYESHVQLARMYEAEGKLDDALNERRLALDVDQDDPDLLVELAETLLKADRNAEAEEALAQAAHLNPRDPRAPYLEGITAEAAGQVGRAREAYTRFLDIAPSRFADEITEVKNHLAALPEGGP